MQRGGFGGDLELENRPSGETGNAGRFRPYRFRSPRTRSSLYIHEAIEGQKRDIRLHHSRDTLVFTISIPRGIENRSLLRFKHPWDGEEIELLFRAKITEKIVRLCFSRSTGRAKAGL